MIDLRCGLAPAKTIPNEVSAMAMDFINQPMAARALKRLDWTQVNTLERSSFIPKIRMSCLSQLRVPFGKKEEIEGSTRRVTGARPGIRFSKLVRTQVSTKSIWILTIQISCTPRLTSGDDTPGFLLTVDRSPEFINQSMAGKLGNPSIVDCPAVTKDESA